MPSLAEQGLAAHRHANDGRLPHLAVHSPAAEACQEAAGGADVYCPPSLAQLSPGREAITRVQVRHFSRTCENVHTVCLQRPGGRWPSGAFQCDWLAAMSRRDGGQTRVACGRYAWSFQPEAPERVSGLKITIGVMQVLPASVLEPVLDWLVQLPEPWCPHAAALATAPPLPALRPVLNYLGQRRHLAALQDAA